MSKENAEEIVRNGHAAFSRGDVDAFVSYWSADCEYEPVVGPLGADRGYRGHDGLRRWWREFAESLEDWSSTIHEIRAAGDHTFVSLTLDVTGKSSRAVVTTPFFQLVTIRDGKIVRSRDFADRGEALEAAGLSE
jgi:ketosteroid isomerase-like protein